MKKYLFILPFVCFISCNLVGKSSVEHCKEFISILNNGPISSTIQMYFDEFYLTKGYYPKSIQEFFDFTKWDKSDIDIFRGCTLRDPYLLNDNIWNYDQSYEADDLLYESCACHKTVADDLLLYYCPIYNRNSDLPVSFVILSVGEDKVLNSNVIEKLYIDNWEKQIKAYNKKKVLDDAMKTTYVAYPIFSKYSHHSVVCFDKATFESKQVILCGDTLFSHIMVEEHSLFDKNDTFPFLYFYYPEYSHYRAVFGKKDYIVACGREFIKYEIITE